MPNIIQLLPDAIANQIAAGEVVQRPASVVKELMENSIDAGATKIKLIIKDAGKQLIQVIDDGKGMTETDARMCFERHATSKIRTTNDLFNIRTMGFRGEAMASIAAVAQVELKTKPEEDELGTLLKIEGSDIKAQEQIVTAKGSVISVKNLFFNVPARRNFLKSNPVETSHIIEEFKRVALANPEIQFNFLNNDLEVFHLPAGKLSQRIVNIFGKNYQGQMVVVNEETEVVKITGYIGKPEAAKKTRGEQFFFANNRFIKHHYLNHAVTEAYEGLLQDKSHPFYVLFIEIDPSKIDINVHPTKTEIKFEDERVIYAVMRAAVKKALGTHNVVPSIDFEHDINFGVSTSGQRDYGNDPAPFKMPPITPRESNNQQNWQQLYDGFDSKPASASTRTVLSSASEIGHVSFQSKINAFENSENDVLEGISEEKAFEPTASITFQLQDKYIVSQIKSGLILVDHFAAQERILYEKYKTVQERKKAASQQFLFPQTIELNATDFTLVMELKTDIEALGFVFNEFGGNTIVVNGIPTDIPAGREKELFEGFLEQFKHNSDNLNVDKKEGMARALAKRAAQRNKKFSSIEMKALIDQLFACSTPNYTPSGASTFIILDGTTIDSYFKKQ